MPEVRYEQEDAFIGNARRWGPLFAGFVIFGSALAVGFFWLMAGTPFRSGPEIQSLRNTNAILPQDNATAIQDIADLRAHEQEVLDTPGPSLVHPGKRRITILQAMRELAASGLPPRPGAPTVKPQPLPAGVLNHGEP